MRPTNDSIPADPPAGAAARLERLLACSNDGYWDHDLVSGLLWRSPRLEELIGPPPPAPAAANAPFGDHVHRDDRDRFHAAIDAHLAGGRPLDAELRLRTRWGSYRWFRARGRAAFDGARAVRLTGTLQDIGDIKRTLRDLRDMSQGLERARDQAQSAARSKSEFLATMSHEIRTPLNGILGMARLLQSTPLTDEQQHYVAALHASGTALLALVNDILDFSRLEAGRIQLDIVEFSLAALIEGVIDVVTPAAREKSLALSVSIAPDLHGPVMGDEGRLRQILINLVGNAVKFTERGSVRIEASAASRDGHLHRVAFSVIDTGIGIAGTHQSRIFDRFTQADSSTARKYGGTGLGLAICRQLVELMDGAIGVESAPGRGSRFWFEVPLVAAGAPASAAAAPAPAVSAPRPLRVLLADDNPINRQYVSVLLGKAGHRVESVGDGEAAVRAVAGGTYDVVLMDVHMPGMDGIAATRAIRALSGPAAMVPVIALTANAMKGDRERYLSAGMTDYVAKPVEIDALAGAMTRSTGTAVTIPAFGASEAPERPLDPAAEAAIGAFLDGLDDLAEPESQD